MRSGGVDCSRMLAMAWSTNGASIVVAMIAVYIASFPQSQTAQPNPVLKMMGIAHKVQSVYTVVIPAIPGDVHLHEALDSIEAQVETFAVIDLDSALDDIRAEVRSIKDEML